MAQLTVGLDLGHDTIKRVRLRGGFRTVEVADFASVPVAQDDRPFLERAAEALQKLDFKGHETDLLATALPGDEVSIRLMTLPFTDSKRIAQTISYELEGQVPFSLDEVVFDYLPIGRTEDGGTRLLLALTQVEPLGQWLAALKGCGLDPRMVGAEGLSYTTLASILPAPPEDQAMAVLDIGHRLTSLCIMGAGGVEFCRTLSGGGRDMTLSLAETFKTDAVRAEDGKIRAGFLSSSQLSATTPEQTRISEAIARSLGTMLREIRQSLATHRTLSPHPIASLWLCGGGSAVDNLDAYLSEELQLPVQRITAKGLGLNGSEQLGEGTNGWAKALALALHAHRGGRHNFLNLRRGPFSFKGDFEFLRGKITHVAVALLIILFLAVGQAVIRTISLSKAERTLDDRLKEVTQAILSKPYDNADVAMSVIKEKTAPGADPLPRITALDVLREIHARLPADLKVRLKDVNISPKKIRLEGFTDSFESVEKVKTALQKYECFTEIQTGNTRTTADKTEVEFTLDIAVNC